MLGPCSAYTAPKQPQGFQGQQVRAPAADAGWQRVPAAAAGVPDLGALHVGSPLARPDAQQAVAAPGMRNETGEYNCFLNVVIQCLWSCQPFGEQVMCWRLRTNRVRGVREASVITVSQ